MAYGPAAYGNAYSAALGQPKKPPLVPAPKPSPIPPIGSGPFNPSAGGTTAGGWGGPAFPPTTQPPIGQGTMAGAPGVLPGAPSVAPQSWNHRAPATPSVPNPGIAPPTGGIAPQEVPTAPAGPQTVSAPAVNAGAAGTLPAGPYQVGNKLAGVGNTESFDRGPMTDVGRTYHASLTRDLTTADNPYVKSIREGAQRQSDKNTFGATSGAEEALGTSGIKPGTSQYNRALAKAQGGANEANLNLQNNAAGAARDFYQNALGKASNYENEMNNRAVAERNNAQDVAKYGDTRTDTQHSSDEATRLEGKGDALAYVNSIKDPKAAAAARKMYEAGTPVKDISNAIYDQYGAVAKPYQSATPGAVEAAGNADRTTAALTGATNPDTGAIYTPQEIKDVIARQAVAGNQTENAPTLQGQTDIQVAKTVQKAQTLPQGQFLSDKEFQQAAQAGKIPLLNLQTGAMDGNKFSAFIAKNPGGLVNIGGKQYRAVRGGTARTSFSRSGIGIGPRGKPRHTDYTQLEGPNGKMFLYDGALHDKAPKQV